MTMWGEIRITPAHAGKSVELADPIAGKEDHPRTRGEKCKRFTDKFRDLGSPPHTRGKVASISGDNTAARITPAHAGKSEVERLYNIQRRDHPRTRGEKLRSIT